MTTRGEATSSAPEEKGGRQESRKPEARAKKTEAPAGGEVRSERSRVLAALEAGLAEAFEGLEILDRDLVFEDERRADLAAVEPTGRAIFVLLAGEDAAETVLAALDLLSFVRANGEVVARHLGDPVDPELAPRVIVVDPRNDPRLYERLEGLGPSGIDVAGVRTVRSASGERSYLVRPKAERREAGASIEALLAGLPPATLDLVRLLQDRMARVDPDCLTSADRDAVVWRARGTLLARLERRGERVEASLPSGTRVPIASEDDVDRVVEGALERIAGGLERARDPARGGRPEALAGDEPLLTPEEIAAFRE